MLSKTLKHAKIDESSLKNVVQILHFDENHAGSSNFKLIELNNHLTEVLEVGDCLSFRGDKKESLVLCSKDKTYDVKEAETSNSVLLVPNFQYSNEIESSDNSESQIIKDKFVTGIFHTYYELIECVPKLSKLLTILQPSAFKGLEYEKTIQKETLYNWDRLHSEIQASDNELENAAKNYMVAKLNGYFRLITFEFEARAVTLMLDFMDSNSWGADEVDKESTYKALEGFIPQPIFELLFSKYTLVGEKTNSNGEQLYSYSEENCCKLMAQVLLSACSATEYSNFMEAWKLGTPDDMNPQEKYLHGIAIVIWNNTRLRKEVVNFPESNLSEKIEERFKELFKAKSKWTVEEISPYISKLATLKFNVNGLLTKYARTSTTNGIKYYSSKHDK